MGVGRGQGMDNNNNYLLHGRSSDYVQCSQFTVLVYW